MRRLAPIVVLLALAPQAAAEGASPPAAEAAREGTASARAAAAGTASARAATLEGGARRAHVAVAGRPFDGATLRLRLTGRCRRAAVTLLLDGRPRRVGATRRWRVHRVSGGRSLTVRLRARKGCRLRVGRVRLLGAPREEQAPAPPPAEPAPPAAPAREPIPLGAAVDWRSVSASPGYADTFLANFDALTPENEMKMELLQPRRGEYDFDTADAIVDWAASHGKRVHGHVLIWNQQAPAWLTTPTLVDTLTGSGAPYDDGELRAILRDHVTTVTRRYGDRIGHWDVVNEAIAHDGSWKPGVWFDALGSEYVFESFRAARAAVPGAKLCYNEIGAEVPGPVADTVFDLVAKLKAEGLIDCVGFQAHVNAATPPAREAVQQTLERFASLGVELHVSEMDVDVEDLPGDDAARFAEQARIFGDVARACRAVAACTRFTTWGFTDAATWLGPSARPLPFDATLAPKPAWAELQAALRQV